MLDTQYLPRWWCEYFLPNVLEPWMVLPMVLQRLRLQCNRIRSISYPQRSHPLVDVSSMATTTEIQELIQFMSDAQTVAVSLAKFCRTVPQLIFACSSTLHVRWLFLLLTLVSSIFLPSGRIDSRTLRYLPLFSCVRLFTNLIKRIILDHISCFNIVRELREASDWHLNSSYVLKNKYLLH